MATELLLTDENRNNGIERFFTEGKMEMLQNLTANSQ